METYISLLRGINVGGNRVLRMNDLRQLFFDLGFTDCQTYIQSGNVVFRYQKANPEELESRISQKILEMFNLQVPVIVKGESELTSIAASNPFILEIPENTAQLHVTLLSANPDPDKFDKIKNENFHPVQYRLLGSAIYLFCPDGYSKSKLTNGFLENKLGLKATTRNWRTITELIRMAEKIPTL
ncbi:MAG: DUF1697 domain-containing protein [Prolixibacteraceae bacterium]|nr:DUF1697 domain-containing protein [Prolixibacteraceae bacterium]